MEYDFSKEAKEFLDSQAAKKSGPERGAETPAEPSEREKGSSKNKKGSAGKDGKKIAFSEKVVTALKNKVKEHNAKHSKKVSLTQLKKIYRRGAGAFSSSHRVGKTRGQWAMARVNMFLKMVSGGEVKKSYRAADQDVVEGSEEYYLEEENLAFVCFDELDFALARFDLQRVDALEESTQEIEDLEYTEAEKKTLNKPFRLKDGKKKFGVYVKNPKTGNVIMVKFGDPNMEIKRDDPDRRRNFRARHKCDTAKDKTTPRYWSCKFWSKKPVSSMASEEVIAWDDNEQFSQWCWNDESFAEHQDLLNGYPFLESVKKIVEDEGEL
jgi:flagellar basal body rod protein FlgC